MKNNKNRLYIRWMGAFAKGCSTLGESLAFELAGHTNEVACERIDGVRNGSGAIIYQSYISKPLVGLIVNSDAVFREFADDCYSERDVSGKLHPTRIHKCPRSFGHTEAWTKPQYAAIVIKGRTASEGWSNLSKAVQTAIIVAAEAYGMKVYQIKSGVLSEVRF